MSAFLSIEKMKVILEKFPMLGLAAGITLLTAACASEPAGSAASAASNDKVAQTGAKVCRHEKLSGTNIPKSICKSAEDWAAIDRAQQGNATEYTRQISEGAAVSNAKNCGQSGGAASC